MYHVQWRWSADRQTLIVDRVSLAGRADFKRLVWPELSKYAAGHEILLPDSLRDTEPASGARHPMLLDSGRGVRVRSTMKREPPSDGGINATLQVKLTRWWPDREVFVYILPLRKEFALARGETHVDFQIDPGRLPSGQLLAEIYVSAEEGAQAVYEKPRPTAMYQLKGSCLLHLRDNDRAPICTPSKDVDETHGSMTLRWAGQPTLAAAPTYAPWQPVLKKFVETHVDAAVRYNLRGADHVNASQRAIHTSYSGALAARSGLQVSATALPRLLFMQMLRKVPFDALPPERREYIAAALLYLGHREASPRDRNDPAVLYAHAVVALPRALGFHPDEVDNLCILSHPLSAVDCEDIAMHVMFLGLLLRHCDPKIVHDTLVHRMRYTDLSLATVTAALRVTERDYTMVWADNCGDERKTTAHDFAMLIPTPLWSYVRSHRPGESPPIGGRVFFLEAMWDSQLYDGEEVVNGTLPIRESFKNGTYVNLRNLSTLDAQYLLLEGTVAGIPPTWLVDDSSRHRLQKINALPLYRASDYSEEATAVLANELCAGNYLHWTLDARHIRDVSAQEWVAVTDDYLLRAEADI